MFEREYRREMDQVKLSQVELDRLVNAMAEEKRRHKRGNLGVWVLLTAAAVFLLTASALALSLAVPADPGPWELWAVQPKDRGRDGCRPGV